ncbi:MAG: M42 family peptidase, partial [Caldivirga sp.]
TTDALGIAFRRDGIPATTISIPTRYVHSPVEVLKISDALNASKLLTLALQKADEKLVNSLRARLIKGTNRANH